MRWVGAAALLEVVGGALVWTLLTPTVRSVLPGLDVVSAPLTAVRVAQWALSDLFVVVLYLVAAMTGVFLTTRRDYITLLRAREAAAIAGQEVRARHAVDAERARMARELHDVAAHHLSGLVVQAAAVERLIDSDPEAAKEVTRDLRAQGKQTLVNLRSLVGVLRERQHSAELTAGLQLSDADGAPVPGLAMLEELLNQSRAQGDDLSFDSRGPGYALSPVADLTVYRMLQESLANARQHAEGAPVHVRLHFTEQEVCVEVENHLIPRPGTTMVNHRGFGLVGMRERANLAGEVCLS